MVSIDVGFNGTSARVHDWLERPPCLLAALHAELAIQLSTLSQGLAGSLPGLPGQDKGWWVQCYHDFRSVVWDIMAILEVPRR